MSPASPRSDLSFSYVLPQLPLRKAPADPFSSFQAFVVAQLVFSSLPILVFSTFAISVIVFALGAAVIFALFWTGVALLVLVSTLFFTCSVAILVWVWAAGSFLLAKWLYEMSPVSDKGELQVDVPNGKKYAITKNEDGIDAHTLRS